MRIRPSHRSRIFQTVFPRGGNVFPAGRARSFRRPVSPRSPAGSPRTTGFTPPAKPTSLPLFILRGPREEAQVSREGPPPSGRGEVVRPPRSCPQGPACDSGPQFASATPAACVLRLLPSLHLLPSGPQPYHPPPPAPAVPLHPSPSLQSQLSPPQPPPLQTVPVFGLRLCFLQPRSVCLHGTLPGAQSSWGPCLPRL